MDGVRYSTAQLSRCRKSILGAVFLLLFIAVAVQLVAIPEALLPVVKLLLFVGVLRAATTMVAMEYCLFSFDNSSDMKKVF
jgi:hypothetical protein